MQPIDGNTRFHSNFSQIVPFENMLAFIRYLQQNFGTAFANLAL